MIAAPGRVLYAAAPATRLRRRAGTVLPTVVLLATLPLFAQSFQYVIDLPALYALSKAWPLLTLPLTVWAALASPAPYKALLLAVIAWLLGVTPFIGVVTLGNDLLGAAAASSKVWALAGALSLAAVLQASGATPAAIARSLLILGVVTFAVMGATWALAPPSAYGGDMTTTKVFLNDPERGYRLNIPMFFGLMLVFALGRALQRRPRAWLLTALVVAFWMMLTIYKARAPIAGAAAVLVLSAALNARRWRGPLLAGMVAIGLCAAPFVVQVLGSRAVTESLGGSLTARQAEFVTAVDFLNAEPLRWLLGVGSATRIGDVSLGDIVGSSFFFPSDLGWLGVVFEYGLVGAVLMLALHLYALRLCWRAGPGGGVGAGALADYTLYMLVTSPIVSVVLAPGELTTCLALGWWIARSEDLRSAHVPRQGQQHDLQVQRQRPVADVEEVQLHAAPRLLR